MKKIASIMLKLLAGILVLLLLLFGLLQTSPGKRMLASGISKAASRTENLSIKVGRISGFIPARIEVESLEVGDREGTWLTASQLHCRWAIQDWVDGVVNIEQLGAGSIELHRMPKVEGRGKPSKEKRAFKPIEFVLGNLAIDKLVLGEGIAGVPLEYAVHSGGIQLRGSGALSGSLEVSGDADGRVELSAPSPGTTDHRLELVAEAGGIAFGLQGTIGKERVDLSGTLTEFDLGQLPLSGISNFTGRVGGRISLAGSLVEPVMSASLDVLDFTTTQATLDELPDLSFYVDARVRDGRLSGWSSITNAVSGSMKARLDMPCSFALKPFRFKMDPRQLTASFRADVDLEILNGLTFLNDQRVQGRLDSDLVYDGQKEDRLVGHLAIKDGAYEHYGWGVVVRDVQAEMDATPEGVVIRKMTATDGGEGRVAVAGRVGIWDSDIPLELQVDIAQANLIRRDEVEAILSGSIRMSDRLSRPSVTGRLVVDRADILLDNIAPPEPRLLTDFDVDGPSCETVVADGGTTLPFAMDIDVSMPDQVFASASVIDSVWGGDLKIKDAPSGVSVAGVIQPRRGYLSFIGKKFRLTDEGRIDLDGAVPPSPSINIGAEYSRSDIVAHLALTGKLDNPQYTLTSTPAMPEDEVLSHVLFGRDTSSISVYQAYQIAAAARQLSGGVRGPGFMYQMRQALSIDTLEWREPDTPDGKSSVAAGKYVTPGLYVEVNSTLENKDGSTGMMAEYEVTKHFSVETSTGPQMRPGIGVNWKNDY